MATMAVARTTTPLPGVVSCRPSSSRAMAIHLFATTLAAARSARFCPTITLLPLDNSSQTSCSSSGALANGQPLPAAGSPRPALRCGGPDCAVSD